MGHCMPNTNALDICTTKNHSYDVWRRCGSRWFFSRTGKRIANIQMKALAVDKFGSFDTITFKCAVVIIYSALNQNRTLLNYLKRVSVAGKNLNGSSHSKLYVAWTSFVVFFGQKSFSWKTIFIYHGRVGVTPTNVSLSLRLWFGTQQPFSFSIYVISRDITYHTQNFAPLYCP